MSKPTPEEKWCMCGNFSSTRLVCMTCGEKTPDYPYNKNPSPSPEARVDWEQQADDFCIWLTGGVAEFSLPREQVMAFWKKEFKKSLQAAFEKGREAR